MNARSSSSGCSYKSLSRWLRHHGNRGSLSCPATPALISRRALHENPLGLPRKGTPPTLARRGLPERRRVASVGKVLAISSAKGGVGKSTVAANLSLALARRGLRTGLLDADLHGPSIPTLFDLAASGPPRLSTEDRLLPLTNYGVRTMSMGYLVGAEQPVAWRGLLIQRALQQLLHEVDWGGLDVLLLDLPPGTGDVPLTIAQQIVLDAALIVSTPSKLARADVHRGAQLWRKMDVPLLGLVRNMAAFRCPCCGETSAVFGHLHADEAQPNSQDPSDLPVLADIPLDGAICATGDAGKPSVVGDPDGPGARVFVELAETVAQRMSL